MDEFKNFIKNNSYLISYVRDGKKTWQELYELFDLYGDDSNVWGEYLKSSNSLNGLKWDDISKMFKNLDVNKVQEGINSIQKTLALFGDLIASKDGKSKTYNPRPLYKRFED